MNKSIPDDGLRITNGINSRSVKDLWIRNPESAICNPILSQTLTRRRLSFRRPELPIHDHPWPWDLATVVEWAGTMSWKGTRLIVKLIETTYEKGVRIAKDAFRAIESRLERHDRLPKYDVPIQPQPG